MMAVSVEYEDSAYGLMGTSFLVAPNNGWPSYATSYLELSRREFAVYVVAMQEGKWHVLPKGGGGGHRPVFVSSSCAASINLQNVSIISCGSTCVDTSFQT